MTPSGFKLKPLDDDLIQKLLFNQKKEDAEKLRRKTAWPSNEDKAIMLKAAKEAVEQTLSLELSCGRRFIMHVNPANGDLFYVMLAKGGTPCGWFRISKIEAELQEGGE